MKQIINDFIDSIDTKLYRRIRASEGDAECRRYLKEHLQKQLTMHSDVERSEQIVCDCGNKLIDKELYFGQCLQCDKNIGE